MGSVLGSEKMKGPWLGMSLTSRLSGNSSWETKLLMKPYGQGSTFHSLDVLGRRVSLRGYLIGRGIQGLLPMHKECSTTMPRLLSSSERYRRRVPGLRQPLRLRD